MDRALDQSERFFVAARLSSSSSADEIQEAGVDDNPTTRFRDQIATLATQCGARIVTNFHKEVVFVFSELLPAVDATRSIHKSVVTGLSVSGAFLRLGLFEPPYEVLDDKTWTATIAKARQLARLARAGQTLACIEQYKLIDRKVLSVEHEVDLGDWYDENRHEHPAHRILWQDESPTRLAIAGSNACPITRVERLLLRWRDQQLVLNKNSESVTMGRRGSSDVAVDSDFASRRHAHLRYAHSCFVLTDCSKNGTYVNIDENEFYLHDDELILRGKGCISLGRRPSSLRGQLIYFSSETVQTQPAH